MPHIEPHALGHGLLQVPDAFSYLRRHDQTRANLICLEVSLPQRLVQGKACRGLYVREPREADRVVQTQVMVEPMWHPDCDNREQVASPHHLVSLHAGLSTPVGVCPSACLSRV